MVLHQNSIKYSDFKRRVLMFKIAVTPALETTFENKSKVNVYAGLVLAGTQRGEDE